MNNNKPHQLLRCRPRYTGRESMVLFQPKYRLGHPENYLFLVSKKTFLDQSIPKKNIVIFKAETMRGISGSMIWLFVASLNQRSIAWAKRPSLEFNHYTWTGTWQKVHWRQDSSMRGRSLTLRQRTWTTPPSQHSWLPLFIYQLQCFLSRNKINYFLDTLIQKLCFCDNENK